MLKRVVQAAFLPQGLRTLWLFVFCQQPAQSHHLSLYQGTNTSTSNNLFPRSETFDQPDYPHTRSYLKNHAYLGGGHKTEKHNETVLGNHPVCPNLCYSLGARQDHISLEDSLGQYVSKTITSLAVDDVMPMH